MGDSQQPWQSSICGEITQLALLLLLTTSNTVLFSVYPCSDTRSQNRKLDISQPALKLPQQTLRAHLSWKHTHGLKEPVTQKLAMQWNTNWNACSESLNAANSRLAPPFCRLRHILSSTDATCKGGGSVEVDQTTEAHQLTPRCGCRPDSKFPLTDTVKLLAAFEAHSCRNQ